MFYVLFTYSKGQKERDFRGFRSEDELIKFLHKDYEKIDIVQIIEVEKVYRLGLIETAELLKSTLIRQEIETDLPDPSKEKTTEEMTDEEIVEKNEALLIRADKALKVAKKDLDRGPLWGKVKPPQEEKKRPKKKKEFDKTNWPKCPECNRRKIAPWNKAGRCSHCQQYKKKPKKPKLDKADLIVAGKKSMEEEKKTWPTCPKCGTRKMAPWNKVGLCSYCQGNRGKKK